LSVDGHIAARRSFQTAGDPPIFLGGKVPVMDRPERQARIIESIGLIFETMDWGEMLGRIVQAVRRCFHSDTASLLLPHQEGGFYVALSEVDTREGPKATGVKCGDGVATRIAARKQPALIVGALENYPLFAGLKSRSSAGSSLVYPILDASAVIGVLTCNRKAGEPFEENDLHDLGTLSSFASMGIQNADLYRRLRGTTEELRRQQAERERMETELRLAQKLESVGQLAAGIAHEINTPIQYVGDSITFLRDTLDVQGRLLRQYREALAGDDGTGLEEKRLALEEAERQEDLAFLEAETPAAIERTLHGVQQVSRIVQAMKQFSHPGRGEHMEPANLNNALEITLTVARAEYKMVADVVTEFGEIPSVVCNIGDLNQVFLNLLVNAAHAIQDVVGTSGDRGQIRVRTALDDGMAMVSISDSGGGIPEPIRDRIFDPFFTTKALGRGTGQGLSIARAIVVDRHRGSLSFDTAIGKGTTFMVRLPVRGPS
jgi:signal transduction histidine kinase